MGFRGSLSSQRKKLEHRLAGRGGSDFGGKGLGLAGLLPKSEPNTVASGMNDGEGKGAVADRGRADPTEPPPQPGEPKFVSVPSFAEYTVSGWSSTAV